MLNQNLYSYLVTQYSSFSYIASGCLENIVKYKFDIEGYSNGMVPFVKKCFVNCPWISENRIYFWFWFWREGLIK